MDEAARGRHRAIRKETAISAVMNVVIGVVFFLIVFGANRVSALSLAIDFLPQTMGMTFLGGTAASLICLSKVAKGKLMPAGPTPTRSRQILQVFGCALAATILFGGAMALLFATSGWGKLEPAPALAMKSVYGIAMALVTTPPILRMALGMPFWPRPRRASLAGASS